MFIYDADHEAVLFSELSDIWPGSEPEGLRCGRGSEVVWWEKRGGEGRCRISSSLLSADKLNQAHKLWDVWPAELSLLHHRTTVPWSKAALPLSLSLSPCRTNKQDSDDKSIDRPADGRTGFPKDDSRGRPLDGHTHTHTHTHTEDYSLQSLCCSLSRSLPPPAALRLPAN